MAHIFRQTPGGDGIWRDMEFVLSDPEQSADWLVVLDEPPEDLTVSVHWAKRILFLTEPPAFKKYPSGYLNQFGLVVSPLKLSGAYRGIQINQQSALPWHYGINRDRVINSSNKRGEPLGSLDWGALAAGPKNKKADLLSVICSNSTRLAQHRRRLKFVGHLKKRLGERVHVFGRGFRPIPDKADGIAPYRYHLVLENNAIDHFWTEKLADAYLGGAFVFYSGCANIGEYFSSRTLCSIDIRKPRRSVDVIETALDANSYDKAVDYLDEARRKVMADYNIFSVCSAVQRRHAYGNQRDLDSVAQSRIYSVSDYWPNRVAKTVGRGCRRLLQSVGNF